ncbi:MAG: hypothetical protein ACKVTZ_12750 [Bacteroidia bacterium]
MKINKKIGQKIRYYAIMSVILYACIEGICAIFIHTNYIPTAKPSFSTQLFSDVIVADVSPYWGRWHPFKTVEYHSECFDVKETCNSYGARDIERKQQADSNRIVLLGDSFIEGYGLKNEDRLSNLLENKLQKEVLNFGCTGIGHIQYSLIYKYLADSFSHNTVMLGFLPANDFLDGDKSIQEKLFMDYRPYWKTEYPACELMYWTDKIENSPYYYKKIYGFRRVVLKSLRNFTYWYNVLYFLVYTQPMMHIVNYGDLKSQKEYSGFYDYTDLQLSQLKCSLASLKNTAKGKKIILFTLPKYSDLLRYKKENQMSKLGKELGSFCEENQLVLIDLLPFLAQKTDAEAQALYHTCDDHFSRAGNVWAMGILLKIVDEGK